MNVIDRRRLWGVIQISENTTGPRVRRLLDHVLPCRCAAEAWAAQCACKQGVRVIPDYLDLGDLEGMCCVPPLDISRFAQRRADQRLELRHELELIYGNELSWE